MRLAKFDMLPMKATVQKLGNTGKVSRLQLIDGRWRSRLHVRQAPLNAAKSHLRQVDNIAKGMKPHRPHLWLERLNLGLQIGIVKDSGSIAVFD